MYIYAMLVCILFVIIYEKFIKYNKNILNVSIKISVITNILRKCYTTNNLYPEGNILGYLVRCFSHSYYIFLSATFVLYCLKL